MLGGRQDDGDLMTSARLAQYTAAPGQGASFVATRDGGFARIEPLSLAAILWLRSNVGEEATWQGDDLIVEMRYFPDLADGIIEAGFLFERQSFPN